MTPNYLFDYSLGFLIPFSTLGVSADSVAFLKSLPLISTIMKVDTGGPYVVFDVLIHNRVVK